MILNEVITDIAAGPFGSNLKVECFVPEGFPIIDGANLKDFKVTDNITKFVTEEKARSLHRSIAKRGDVISTISGTLGQIAYIPDDSKYEEYLVSQRQFRITFNTEKVNVPFLVYYFHSRIGQSKILAFANQVGVPALAQPLKNFRNIEVNFPPIDVQNKIASILSSLDDKISVNKKICENLEAQAQALFKHWFVDFAPFKDGNFCANRELNETCFNSAEVQPKITGKACKFVESELGLIPEGWRVGKLSELIDVKYGKDHKKLLNGNIPVYGSGGLMRKVDRSLYEGESVLIPRKGTLNNVMYVNEAFWTVDTMFYSIPKRSNIALYTYILLSKRDLASMNAGSAVPSMTTDILNNMQIVIPNEDVLAHFNSLVSVYYAQIKHNEQESRHLATLRDTLLPKLMSGQIKVNEIEKSL